MAVKRTRRERPPSSSSEEEDLQANQINRCPVFIGKNVDLASFTFDVPSFNIENLFIGMGWVPILTLNDKVYPSIVKDFYTKMTFSPRTGITCLVRNKRIKITQELIRSILHLEDGGIHLYTTKTILHIKEYNPVGACCRVTEKHFEAARTGNGLVKSKGFDNESEPSTLPFKGEEMVDDEDELPPRPHSQRPSSSTFGFTEDHFNLLNGQIDLLTSSVEGLHNTVEDLRYTMGTL
ncbi:Uncharacterized protein Adt_41619 [Abeliophyllum distichum]|uniref:Uncharacterized protein n=1 Tax=Abeliophyllum distichum TaxID=126358 RepID=A0ABD1PPC2_9LAMI